MILSYTQEHGSQARHLYVKHRVFNILIRMSLVSSRKLSEEIAAWCSSLSCRYSDRDESIAER